MSDELVKVKHSKRIHAKQVAVKKQEKIAKSNGIQEKEPHRYAKKHAMNCGNPNCVMCGNPRKTIKEETKQEKSFKQKELQLE